VKGEAESTFAEGEAESTLLREKPRAPCLGRSLTHLPEKGPEHEPKKKLRESGPRVKYLCKA